MGFCSTKIYEVFVQISENYIGRAIRTPQYTYAVKGDGNAWIKDRAASYYNDCLYDNYKDPYQNENLIEDKHYINVKEHLKQRLIHHIQTVENYTPVIYD